MRAGDMLGHEFMGEVVEVGPATSRLRVGDRVVVPFTIACGQCYFCKEELWSLCDNSNPNAWMAEKLSGFSGSGLFGYSHMYGGYPGGQAEYARVPFADVGPIKVPDSLSDEQVLFLSDIFPTGYMAAENCHIQRGERWRSGGAARWVSSRSRARICSAPSASSRSIVFPSGSRWRPARERPRCSTTKTSMCRPSYGR